ncbi:Peptidoglycan-binding Lysin subgroup [Penicillium expansum]|nr:Peptidoglycan-binding Lysin subgroup [Penicillium expansum]KGO68177.1 Peptidoglycan-binding Lysin subgroup [Penicillium expansum]
MGPNPGPKAQPAPIRGFGVKIDQYTNDVDLKDEANVKLWEAIGDHISLVTKFLAGGGPTDYGAGGKPLLFCGAEAGVHQPWDTSIVKDHEGKNVVTDRDPKTKMPTKYLNLGLAFMGVSRNPNANAFWMSKFDGYDLDYDDDTSLCAENPKDGRLRYAKVAKRPFIRYTKMRLPPLATAIPLAVVWASLASVINANKAANALLASISVSTVSGTAPGRPTDLVSAQEAILAGDYTKRLHYQGRDVCPVGCSNAGIDTSSWFVYGSLNRLDRACDRPMLLDFALANPIDTQKSHVAISACTADYENFSSFVPSSDSATSCASKVAEQAEVTFPLLLKSSGASSSQHVADVTSALEQLQAFAILSNSGCNETIKYFYSGDVIVGVYAGSGLAGQGVLSTVLEKLSTRIKDDGSVAESWSVEMCSNSSARYSLSVLVNTKGKFGAVQRGLQASKNGTCFSTETEIAASDWETVTYLAASASSITSTANPNKLTSYRATACRTIQVVSGDSCASLATQCGITAAQFTKYNSDPSLCSGLTPGKHVCCSPGTLPDFTPKPSADGYCYSNLVKSGDSCASLAAANDLTNAKIESFNKMTWGWNGCEKPFAKYKICLSTGYPPMPATIPNAVCGPQVNDTVKAPPETDLSTLNECPLNACCNIWGQCGTTGDFCTPSNSSTGAPGTAAPGKNGCISNCGTNIVTSSAPGKTYNVSYHDLGGRPPRPPFGEYNSKDSRIPANFSCERVVQLAMEMGHSTIVQLLIDAGADTSLPHPL